MWLFIAISLIVCLATYFYLYHTWNNEYWKERGIPFEKPLFFFGNCIDAFTGKSHLHLIYCKLYEKFPKVPYFGCFKMRDPAVVVRDLDIIKDVLIKDFNSFANNDFHVNQAEEPIVTGNTFVLTGEEWKVRRAQWTSGMTLSKLRHLHVPLTHKAKETVKYLNKHIEKKPDEALEARELAAKHLTDSIAFSMLGFEIDSFEDPNNSLQVIASNMFAPDFWQGLLKLCYTFAPWIHKFVGSGILSKKVENQLIDLARQVIEARKKTGINNNDFFEALLKEETVSELDVASLVFGLISEGVDSSSTVASYAMFELASNPHVQTKLRNELEKAVASTNGEITFEIIQSLPYLDQVVYEILRMHPGVFIFSKVCTKPYTFPPVYPGGIPFQVPVGMTVTIPVYSIQMDPTYFKDPEKFDPDRHSDENKGFMKKYSFMPFSDGPRICVGMKLGLLLSKVCIAHLIKNFEVKLSPETKLPLQVDASVVGNRAVGIWVTFHKPS